jgi:AraC-like DNA-binding protein
MTFQALERKLTERVAEPFSHACGAIAVVAKVGTLMLDPDRELPPNPGHPLCTREACSDYCRESWQLHLAQIRIRPSVHMHRCKFGRLCAVVPVVYQGHCLAATKLVCPPNVSETRFRHLVSILDALVRDFVATERENLECLVPAEPQLEPSAAAMAVSEHAATDETQHPLIRQAIQYIDDNLSDPHLTVRRVAEALGLNTNYLSHMFANEVGERMGIVITKRRIAKAQALLSTTSLQIKCIAQDTGHANPNWFSHVFRVVTGITPNQYRARAQRSIA